MSLTPAFLDELRSRTSLSGLIRRTVKLQKAGREWKGCCPFHNEKSPSFFVNDDKEFYHCFGCGAHGDAIRWMTDQQGLPFMDAVKELAQAAGLEVPQADPRAVERTEKAKGLHQAMQAAADWFEQQLGGLDGTPARELLARRGINDSTRRRFNFGYAPDSRSKLRTALRDFGDETLIEAGLLIKVDGKEPYDRFRGRLMIPIRDSRGRVIAFGGRIIGEGEPKYLNSPETPLFDKGRTLFNLDLGQAAARKTGRVIAVEGYMDVVALAQAGIEDAVAPLGTALTEDQLERLWRISDTPVLCFDGDAAGHRAAIRAAHRALPVLETGRRLKFVNLPAGKDPDDVVSSGGAPLFSSFLSQAMPLEEFLWRSELAGLSESPGPDDRALLKKRLLGITDQMSDQTLATEYRRSFLDRFFALFGAKKKGGLEVVRDSVVNARRHPGNGLEYTLHRAVLLGLMRYPRVLQQYVESVAMLPIKDNYLSRWQDELVKLAYNYRTPLSEETVNGLLEATTLWPIEPRDFKRDLAFSFFIPGTEAEEAERDLERVIGVLLEEHHTRQAARLANEAFARDMTETRFDRQQRAVMAAAESQRRLFKWIDHFAEAA